MSCDFHSFLQKRIYSIADQFLHTSFKNEAFISIEECKIMNTIHPFDERKQLSQDSVSDKRKNYTNLRVKVIWIWIWRRIIQCFLRVQRCYSTRVQKPTRGTIEETSTKKLGLKSRKNEARAQVRTKDQQICNLLRYHCATRASTPTVETFRKIFKSWCVLDKTNTRLRL